MKKYSSIVILVLGLALLLLSNACYKKIGLKPLPGFNNPVAVAQGEAGAPLEVGFGKEVITPEGSVYMGGFGQMRKSRGVHDDLYARAIVLRQGKEKLAMVSVDCVGIQRTDILKLKAAVPGYRPDQILIASTHTHSGPDTIGFWGLPPLFSGMDEKYMQRLGKAIADIIAKADAAAVPVSSSVAVYPADPAIMFNANEGEPEDHTLGLMVFKDQKGGDIATLWNLAGHAETMWGDNHLITADFPGRVNELIEKEYGGGSIFFNADLGAMMTPAYPPKGQPRDWARLERVSEQIFAEVKRGQGLLQEDRNPVLVHKMSLIAVPFSNDTFKMLVEYGILRREVYDGNRVLAEVNLIEIGSAQFVTFPGEDYPKQGLKIRAQQKPHSFQISLADDELGYIIYPEDYGTKQYDYETSMCAGPELSVSMEKALLELLGK